MFRRRRRNSPKNPEVKGCEGWRFAIANTTPSLEFWIAWYALRGRRPSVPEVALRVGACGANKKTRPAKCQIDKAGGFSYNGFTNYMDFYEFVVDTYEDMNYIEVMRCYSGHFERMTRGNYQRWEQGQRGLRPSQAKVHEKTTKTTPDCCPACGSVDIVKRGKTLANTQRWACKDCGKRFV